MGLNLIPRNATPVRVRVTNRMFSVTPLKFMQKKTVATPRWRRLIVRHGSGDQGCVTHVTLDRKTS